MNIRKKLINEALESWGELVRIVPELTRKELESAIKQEYKDKSPRKTFIVRLHQRFTAVRAKEEREKLLEGL